MFPDCRLPYFKLEMSYYFSWNPEQSLVMTVPNHAPHVGLVT